MLRPVALALSDGFSSLLFRISDRSHFSVLLSLHFSCLAGRLLPLEIQV